jgi:hypothetical protein
MHFPTAALRTTQRLTRLRNRHRQTIPRLLYRTVLVAANRKGVVQQTRGHVGSRDLVDCFLTPNHIGMFTRSQPYARIRRMNLRLSRVQTRGCGISVVRAINDATAHAVPGALGL